MTEAVAFVRFLATCGILVAAYLTLARYARYRQRGLPVPRLLIRDSIVMGAIGLTFLFVAILRLTGENPYDVVDRGWLLFSRLAYCVAFWSYAYFEWRMID